MPVFCAIRRGWLTGLLVLAAVGLPACGAEAPGPAEVGDDTPGSEWSQPSAPDGIGSPDGPSDQVQGAEELLADLRSRIAGGRGHADASYQRSAELVGAVLWDVHARDGSEDLMARDREAAAAHQKVAAIAGDVSRWLVVAPSARAERAASHPTDLAIHDAFLDVSAKGADAYRLWCGGQALRLLAEHREAVYRKLMPDREPQPRVDGPGDSGQGK